MTDTSYTYTAYGLSIRSFLPMPEFMPAIAPPDVTFRLASIRAPEPPPRFAAGTGYRAVSQTVDGVLLHWSTIGSFLVSGGDDIAVCPVDGADDGLLRLVLSGPALAVLLAQRGDAVFHAGAVVDPSARAGVAIVARSGVGKSTMITALHNAGFYLLADDVLCIRASSADAGGHPNAVPGFPHAKLWGESAHALLSDAASLVPLSPQTGKLARPITERFADAPARLYAAFVLADAPEIAVRPLTGHAAVGALLPHWYGACLDGQLMGILGRERHLREVTALAASVRVYELARPRVMARLPEVVSQVRAVLERDGCRECR